MIKLHDFDPNINPKSLNLKASAGKLEVFFLWISIARFQINMHLCRKYFLYFVKLYSAFDKLISFLLPSGPLDYIYIMIILPLWYFLVKRRESLQKSKSSGRLWTYIINSNQILRLWNLWTEIEKCCTRIEMITENTESYSR